eukprot:1490440-Pyramimonas_sp.AAC.1
MDIDHANLPKARGRKRAEGTWPFTFEIIGGFWLSRLSHLRRAEGQRAGQAARAPAAITVCRAIVLLLVEAKQANSISIDQTSDDLNRT